MAISSRLERCVKDVIDWINEHQRLAVRTEHRARNRELSGLTTEEEKENRVARSLVKLRKKARKGDLPASAASQLQEVNMRVCGISGPYKRYLICTSDRAEFCTQYVFTNDACPVHVIPLP
jgi:hypothetical protein